MAGPASNETHMMNKEARMRPRNEDVTMGALFRLTGLIACLCVVSCGAANKRTAPLHGEDDPMIYYQKGANYLNTGQCDEAEKAFRRSLAMDSRNSVVHNALGLAQICKREYASAIQSFKRAIEQNPFYTDVHNNLGIAYMESGDYDNALVEFNRALGDKHYQTPEVLYFNIGLVYFKMGNYARAESDIKKALELKPDRAGWRLQLAMVYERLEDYEMAVEELQKARELEPDNTRVLFLLGRLLYSKLNQPQEARPHLCKVAVLVPDTEMGKVAADLCRAISP